MGGPFSGREGPRSAGWSQLLFSSIAATFSGSNQHILYMNHVEVRCVVTMLPVRLCNHGSCRLSATMMGSIDHLLVASIEY